MVIFVILGRARNSSSATAAERRSSEVEPTSGSMTRGALRAEALTAEALSRAAGPSGAGAIPAPRRWAEGRRRLHRDGTGHLRIGDPGIAGVPGSAVP